MLQSLFHSQFDTLGSNLIALLVIFIFVFRSIKFSVIALMSNIISLIVVFGFMGWLGIPLDIMGVTIASIALGVGVDDETLYTSLQDRAKN